MRALDVCATIAIVLFSVTVGTAARANRCNIPTVTEEGEVIECPSHLDYGSPYIVQRPEESCCGTTYTDGGTCDSGTTYKRWTRPRVASRVGAAITLGSPEAYSLDTGIYIPPTTSSCLGLSVVGGDILGSSVQAYAEDVAAIAASESVAAPLFFRGTRFDDIVAPQLVTNDVATGISFSTSDEWILHTDRDWSDFLAFHTTACPGGGSCCYSHCRAPGTSYTAANCAYDYPIGAHANDEDGGCDDSDDVDPEFAWTLATQMYSRVPDSEEHVVYSVFYRGGSAQKMFNPVALIADLTNPDYQEWAVEYAYQTMVRDGGVFTGLELILKDHFYRSSGGSSTVKHWIDMGDGLGGYLDGTGNPLDTLTEAVAADDFFSGPPEIPDGVNNCDSADATWSPISGASTIAGCRFTWPYYIYGMVGIAREMYNHVPRIPYLVKAGSYQYRGCLTSFTPTEAAGYDDGLNASTGCADNFDDPTTTTASCTGVGTPHPACTGVGTCDLNCNEAAMFREIYQRAGYVLIDVQGNKDNPVVDGPPVPVDGGIGFGSGNGNGITLAELTTMIEAGDPAPIWVEWYDSNEPLSVPPVLCSDPAEPEQPGTPVTPSAISVEIVQHCSAKSGTSIASPAFCNFTANVTHTNPLIDVYHGLKYAWDFGDSGSSGTGNWTYGSGRSRNVEDYPVAAHVFECSAGPCVFGVSLTVTDYAGDSATDTVQVTVVTEDAAWAPADTVCFGATATGCPTGATFTATSDFDAGFQTAAGTRTLYECGQTFVASSSPNVASAAANGSLVGGYGSCAGNPPIVTWAPNSSLFDDGDLDGWRFRDIEFRATATPDADSVPSILTNLTGYPQVSDFLALRVNATGVSGCPGFSRPYSADIADGYNDRVGFVDVYCEAADTPNPGGWPGSLHSYRYGAWLGYRFRNVSSAPANAAGMRMMGQDSFIAAHGSYEIATTGGGQAGPWSWRSCSGLNTGAGGCDRTDRKVVLADYEVWDDGMTAAGTIQLTNSHDLTDAATGGTQKEDYLLDGLLIHYGSTATRTALAAIRIDGLDGLTISNSVIDFRRSSGAPSSGTDNAILQSNICNGGATDCDADNDFWLHGNTVIENGTGTHSVTVISGSPTGSAYAVSNLAYEDGQSDGITLCSGTWDVCATGGGNVALNQSAACPFAGATGSCDLSAASESWNAFEADIRAAGGGRSSVDNDGYDYTGGGIDGWAFRDWSSTARTHPDDSVGAFED